MATHPSILSWRVLWTEEPDGLQSMGSQKSQDTTEQLTHVVKSVGLTVPGLVKSTLRARLCRIWLLKRRMQTLCRYSGVICRGQRRDGW